MANCKKELSGMEIIPAKNGGHTVRHTYRPKPVMKRGAMSGGFGMDYPPSEDHSFGKGEGKQMMAHIAKHLGVTPAPAAPTQED